MEASLTVVEAALARVLRLDGFELLLGGLWIDFAKNRHGTLAEPHRGIWTRWVLGVCLALLQSLELIGRYGYAARVAIVGMVG